ncbi:MAG: replicative DNA helicase [bacterium]|nr:replicative DNA helicase [bacterium]MDZ4296154.1 replicative DNA helicase [Patescibacteria group bacterium]
MASPELTPITQVFSSSAATRVPPQAVEAEQSVLGALMIDKEAIHRIADMLAPADFYMRKHNRIYEAMFDLYRKSDPIDFLSTLSRLRERGELEDVGGGSYLTELINLVPTAAHVHHYASIVKRKKILRDLIQASQEITDLGFQEHEDIDMVLDNAEQKIFAVSQQSVAQDFQPVKATLTSAFERLEELHRNRDAGALRGVPTGFTALDNLLSGLQKSDLIILAARPSLGKTSLALDILRHVGTKGKLPVGIFSLEMSRDQLVDRLIAAESKVDLWRLRTGRLSADGPTSDFERIQYALGSLAEAPIFIDDTPMLNVIQIRTMARRLQAEHGLSLIVVDYLQLIQGRSNIESLVQQTTEISRSLKALARELQIPVLALSQLSRAVEQRSTGQPKLSDLRDSGSLEQDADVVMFIYREDRERQNSERQNIADIIIAKHRNGPVGRVSLYFDAERASFQNLEKTYADPGFGEGSTEVA